MSFVTPITTKNAPVPVAAYSQAIKANGFVYISGQVPLTPENQKVEGDIKAQTKQVLENLKAIVIASGSQWEKLVKINIFITDMDKFAQINEVYAEYFANHKPARSCVAVKTLPMNVDIEIEAVALE